MNIKYADSYLDRVFSEKDSATLHQIVSTKREIVSGRLWLACRFLEWIGSTRSGVWQWHEGIEATESKRIIDLLAIYAPQEILEWYRFGESSWEDEGEINKLDDWLEQNESTIQELIWKIANPDLNLLKVTN